MSEETNETQEKAQEEEQKETQEPTLPRSEDVIEIEWEEIEDLVKVRAEFFKTENHLAKLLLEHEKQKAMLMARSSQYEALIYKIGSELRTEKNIDDQYTYEIKLPTTQGEKAYFVRKET